MNNINGGSTQYYIKKIRCKKFKINKSKIELLLNNERSLKLNKPNTFKIFYKNKKRKKNLIHLLKKIKAKKKIIHGYGASTKGNVLLQYFGINKDYLDVIADRNLTKTVFLLLILRLKLLKKIIQEN